MPTWQGGSLCSTEVLRRGALVSFLLYALYVAGAIGSLRRCGAYQEAVGAPGAFRPARDGIHGQRYVFPVRSAAVRGEVSIGMSRYDIGRATRSPHGVSNKIALVKSWRSSEPAAEDDDRTILARFGTSPAAASSSTASTQPPFPRS